MKQHTGIILPSTMIILSIISLLVAVGTYACVRTSTRWQSKIHSESHISLLNNSLVKSKQNSLSSASNIGCKSEVETSNKLTFKKAICSQLPTTQTLIDFYEISKELINCPHKKLSPYFYTNTGLSISEGSIISPLLCKNLPLTSDPVILLEGNLDLSDPLSPLGPLEISKSLFATGYISSTQPLIIKNNINIIAGGDIILNNIATDPLMNLTLTLTLTSRTGEVSFVSTTPGIKVFCNGKSISCPSAGGLGLDPTWIPMRYSQTIGLY